MSFQIPGGVDRLFGGATRTKILGYLAASRMPQTGYVIAKDLGIGVSKVYPQLKQLERIGVLLVRADANGRKRFSLADEDLRRFLLRRVRILPPRSRAAPAPLAEKSSGFEALRASLLQSPSRQSRRGKRPFEEEFRRPPEKDRALRRVRKAWGDLR